MRPPPPRASRHDVAPGRRKGASGVWLHGMRKGMDGLALLVQEVLRQDPFSGHLFVFRGRKGGRASGVLENVHLARDSPDASRLR
jgi:hypothetical protein